MKRFFAIALLAATLTNVAGALWARDWGARENFAVVNPIVRSENAKVISLSGTWDFSTENPFAYQLGVGEGLWEFLGVPYRPRITRTIEVPGIWQAQGVGEQGKSEPWDATWDCGDWTIRNRYVGSAFYCKTVKIPEDWAGQRVWLKVGGVLSQARFWVNGKRAAFVETHCGARKFDVTDLLKAGEDAEITALVRNDAPSRCGLFHANECIGGFYRDVELEATPNVYVDDVWARGDFANRSADIRVYVKAIDNKGLPQPLYDDELSPMRREELAEALKLVPKVDYTSKCTIKGFASVEVQIKNLDGTVVACQTLKSNATTLSQNGLAKPFRFNIPIKNCKLWSPETPNLYLADVVLRDQNGAVVHSWTERFGVREFKVVGNQFYLNGNPYFLRGGGDHNYDQINVMELGNHDVFREHMKLYKRAGFNYMRFHTHSPLPEYFEMADEMGILLAPELPYYHDVPCEAFEFNPKREMYESFRTNRRYVSFATYCYGNEGFLGAPLDQEMYDWVKKYDPDRLVVHQDGGFKNNAGVNSDFSNLTAKNQPTHLPWDSSANANADYPVPFVAHEYLNLAIKMDPRLESKFTGARVSPVSEKAWRDKLAALGLNEKWGAQCVAASEVLQGIYQKRGIESARSDFSCDGYIFWSLVDASIPQGSCVAAQGYLDSFWNTRPHGVQPEEFYRFNGPTALLLSTDLDAPILTPGAKAQFDFNISHYDADAIPAGKLVWKFVSRDGKKTLLEGALDFDEIPAGYAGNVGSVDVEIPADVLNAPEALELVVTIDGSPVVNSWNYWFFPAREKKNLNGVRVSREWLDAFQNLYDDVQLIDPTVDDQGAVWVMSPEDPLLADALVAGKKIFLLTHASPAPNVALGWWSIGTQVGAALDKESPAFKGLPVSDVMDELWFRLVRHGAPDLAAKPLGSAYEPLFVGEGRDSYYLYLGQTRVKNSPVLFSYALDLTQDAPEATALLDTLVDYVKSDAFAPLTQTQGVAAYRRVNPQGVVWGFQEYVEANMDDLEPWFTLYETNALDPTCRQFDGAKLVWKTAPRALDDSAEKVAFQFVGALGYWSQPKTDGFLLSVDGKDLIRFDIPESQSVGVGETLKWTSEDGSATLEFNVGRVEQPGPDFFGVFTLVVDRALLDPNDAQTTLAVKSLGKESRRWFTVNSYKGLLEKVDVSKL